MLEPVTVIAPLVLFTHPTAEPFTLTPKLGFVLPEAAPCREIFAAFVNTVESPPVMLMP